MDVTNEYKEGRGLSLCSLCGVCVCVWEGPPQLNRTSCPSFPLHSHHFSSASHQITERAHPLRIDLPMIAASDLEGAFPWGMAWSGHPSHPALFSNHPEIMGTKLKKTANLCTVCG